MKKICTQCNIELPQTEEFFAYRENGIFRRQCRKCINKNQAKRQAGILKDKRKARQKKLDEELELFKSGYKSCSKCEQKLTLNQFTKHPTSRFKITTICKNCTSLLKSKRKSNKDGFLRKCKACGVEAKSIIELDIFDKGSNYKFGRQNICIKCRNSSEKSKKRNSSLSRRCAKFGITVERYNKMVSSQNNSCAICKKDKEKFGGRGNNFHIDHCHESGEVRGLLCSNCNTGLGQFKDNVESLKSAIQYLS